MVLPGETTIPFKKRYIYKKNIKQYLRPEMGWGYHEPCTATGCFTGGPYEVNINYYNRTFQKKKEQKT